ncbi:MAG: NAD(P)/FAD-dependent oxidoreductase [Pyrinomonadaceae bacterium]|nr:NAD(P)/FAD-dependent oxidoreductase [Pyrinomonadaceae bacterium]
MRYDTIIIGAGAAGLFCAIEAGKRGRKILLIEHNSQVGRKILISGGGRCNFTNISVQPENFISGNPHFCKSALARYTPHDFIELVEKHGIKYYEKTLGQLFCRERSHLIVDMLLQECEKAGVEILTDCSVKKVAPASRRLSGGRPARSNRGRPGHRFNIESTKGSFTCDNLVIATGGLSFPKVGASSFGYDIAKQFGINLTKTRPSLVSLRFNGGEDFSGLAGISVDSEVKTGKISFRENILFTHKGLSGPAILQISNYWKRNQPVSINLIPETDLFDVLTQTSSNHSIKNFLSKYVPSRVADAFCGRYIPNEKISEMAKKQRFDVAEMLNNWRVEFGDTEGWHKAEVTLGGVDTDEISSQTMESKKVEGLYFIGEVLDVTGWLGGYNFQWAWSSGFACGQSV